MSRSSTCSRATLGRSAGEKQTSKVNNSKSSCLTPHELCLASAARWAALGPVRALLPINKQRHSCYSCNSVSKISQFYYLFRLNRLPGLTVTARCCGLCAAAGLLLDKSLKAPGVGIHLPHVSFTCKKTPDTARKNTSTQGFSSCLQALLFFVHCCSLHEATQSFKWACCCREATNHECCLQLPRVRGQSLILNILYIFDDNRAAATK